jgi:hypothetical protein
MTAHLIADDSAPVTTVDPATTGPGWLALSAALTEEVPMIADREDLLVTVAPGAGQDAPACFLPAHATIELDGTHLGGVDPATATPHRISDRARYPTAWGLLTHECAHAAHTTWQPPPDAPPGALAAALLLEESRIEAAQIRRRPDDRHWLRASATDLILADTHADDPAHAPAMTTRDAAQTAALLLARTDGGILTRAETAPVARAVATVLGTDTLAKLRAVWQAAHQVADDDAPAMIELGRQWCEILGTDPDTPDQPRTTTAEQPPNGSATPSPSPLAEAITTSLHAVARAVAREPVPADPAAHAATAKAAQHAADKATTKAAHAVFTVGGPRTGKTTTAGTRPPTAAERTTARVLARALTTAGVRDRVTTKTTSPSPPGRLRMRGALAADAQRAAGALPTAEPFTRTTRTTVPTPPLRIRIACDVSGSMHRAAPAVASAAWILAHAAHHTTVPTDNATVIFGHHVRPVTRPGTAPAQVTEFDATDNWEDIPTAIDALDGALGLSRAGAARLLVIVSDGHFREDPRRDAQQRLDRLRATGCGALWLTTDTTDTPLDGVTVHLLSDPATTAQAIGHAATTALRTTTH